MVVIQEEAMQADGLPLTRDALEPAILRAHYQAMVWYNDIVANSEPQQPQEYGWSLDGGNFNAVMTSLSPAPDAVVHLVKCSCTKTNCSTNRCKCKNNGLQCTELRNCTMDRDSCENAKEADTTSEDENSDDECDEDM